MKIFSRFRALFRRNQLDRDMAEEMRFHLDERTDDHVDDGMRANEARAAARRKFGGVAQIQEQARDVRRWVWLEQTVQDIRYALRQLRKSPGFTAVVVVTLALGIGATTAIYSVIDTLILNPIPGPDSGRLIQIGEWIHYTNAPEPTHAGVTLPVLEALENEQTLFSDFAWHDSAQFLRQTDSFVKRIFGQRVSANFFSLLHAQPLLGRTFVPEDAVAFGPERRPETDAVIVISHSWWRSYFGGDPSVLGSTITLSDCPLTIVGVMPSHFQFPTATQFWIPALPDRPQPRRMSASSTRLLVRLKPEVDDQQVRALLDVVTHRLISEYPSDTWGYGQLWNSREGGLRLWSSPLRQEIQSDRYNGRGGFDTIQRTLFGLLAAIGFVLAIVCANVANLTLASTERRQQEFAVRGALGAGRRRLVRQLLTENVVLAVLGGLGGLAVTVWGMRLLESITTVPQLRAVEVSSYVLFVTLALSLTTGLVFGLVPAFRAGRIRIYETFKQCGTGATAAAGRNTYRSSLVIGQVALAVILLTGAGLMIQSVVRLLNVDTGIDARKLLAVTFRERGEKYDGWKESHQDARNLLYARLHEHLTAIPGVTAVGVFKDEYNEKEVTAAGREESVFLYRSGSGIEESDFFRTTGVPLLAGRYLNRSDIGEKVGTVLINETAARLLWPGENAIGKRFHAAIDGSGRWPETYQVVGVTGDMRLYQLDEDIRPMFFRPYHEIGPGGLATRIVMRTQGDPAELIPAVRRAVADVEPRLENPRFQVAWDDLYDSTRTQRTYCNYLIALATVGLLLAALGIYGVLAYSVARRTKEIGIRMAVGAERKHVLSLVISDGARLIVIGVVLGLLAAFWLTRYLQNQLFEVSPTDPGVLASVVVVLSAVALLACYLPARRAANVDPVIALRAE